MKKTMDDLFGLIDIAKPDEGLANLQLPSPEYLSYYKNLQDRIITLYDNIDIDISADGEDLILESGSERGATHIIIYTEAGEKVVEFSLNSLAAGVTRLHTNGVAGSRLCIVKVRSDNDVKIAKVIFKPNSKQ